MNSLSATGNAGKKFDSSASQATENVQRKRNVDQMQESLSGSGGRRLSFSRHFSEDDDDPLGLHSGKKTEQSAFSIFSDDDSDDSTLVVDSKGVIIQRTGSAKKDGKRKLSFSNGRSMSWNLVTKHSKHYRPASKEEGSIQQKAFTQSDLDQGTIFRSTGVARIGSVSGSLMGSAPSQVSSNPPAHPWESIQSQLREMQLEFRQHQECQAALLQGRLLHQESQIALLQTQMGRLEQAMQDQTRTLDQQQQQLQQSVDKWQTAALQAWKV
ncbi:hypothetical protein FisN_18Hu141 [Fistulifera solaris]|uniref:Uncharacterized protein n=1 Tax=Fistulifera solaris TaxID=1519565 RepID=A0A1Z5JV62_FISSO|nr:hypothetical protein FisN_18Hu141 [Fistulifera solaris]|eukprot:GAX17933.1 hypothetical protein FisN_18Hu141 [Fistulifera solaris]